MRHDEHSEHFAEEFRYDSALQSHEQSCEQSLDYLILSNLHKTMKIVRMTEISRVNEISILYITVTDLTSKSQLELDNYYMNTVMKLAMNIITEYESSLEEEKST